jgi:hypothetical protein
MMKTIRWCNTRSAVTAAVLGLGAVACGSDGTDTEATVPGNRAQAVEREVAQEPAEEPAVNGAARAEAHGRSAPAVVIGWVDGAETVGKALKGLTVRVINTTAEKIEADVAILMLAPDAAERTQQPLGHVSLEPEGKADLAIDLTGLRVQTSGVATPVQVVASYQGSPDVTPPKGTDVDEPRAEPSVGSTFSSSLYITHDDDFGSALIRSEEDESRRNGELFLAGALPRMTGMRVDGQRVAADALSQSPVQRVILLPAGAMPLPPKREAVAE